MGVMTFFLAFAIAATSCFAGDQAGGEHSLLFTFKLAVRKKITLPPVTGFTHKSVSLEQGRVGISKNDSGHCDIGRENTEIKVKSLPLLDLLPQDQIILRPLNEAAEQWPPRKISFQGAVIRNKRKISDLKVTCFAPNPAGKDPNWPKISFIQSHLGELASAEYTDENDDPEHTGSVPFLKVDEEKPQSPPNEAVQ